MTRAAMLSAGLVLCALKASATEVYIGLEGSHGEKLLAVALPPFAPEDSRRREDTQIGFKLRGVVRSDLLFSRYFQLVEASEAVGQTPEDWKKLGAAFLLAVQAAQVESKITLTAKLQDLSSGQTLFERYYRQSLTFWRSAAHCLADDIVRQLSGRSGVAETQIAFANDKTGSKEICIVDYDGEGMRSVTSNGSINLLPRWSPDKNLLAFTSYRQGNPDLYLYDLQHGTERALSDRQGLNLAGAFSPDGGRLAATISDQKNPNIYLLSLGDGSAQKVTSHFGVDSSPTFSPDGAYLAFVSNRAGNPEIHVLELATDRLRRLTRLNWCDSPSWSPTGEWIAFAGRANPKDKMDIFLVDVTGTRLIQLTHSEGSNEDPSWSPDGRFIAFTTNRDGRRRIYVMDADGSAPHALSDMPGNSYTPSWSP